MKPKASKHHRWNPDGIFHTKAGYQRVRVGDHPLADPYGYAYMHHVVWFSAGRTMVEGECLHHVNGDKTDNRLENLRLMSTHQHAQLHASKQKRQSNGRFA